MRHRDTMVYMGLLDGVKERIANKTESAKPSVAVRGLEKQQDWGLNDIELAYACSAPWQAGGSTVRSVFHMNTNFLLTISCVDKSSYPRISMYVPLPISKIHYE